MDESNGRVGSALPLLDPPTKTSQAEISRWRAVSLALGFLMLAAGAADCRQLLLSPRAQDWSSIARFEFELYGGLWLIAGEVPGLTWRVILSVFAAIGLIDLVQIITGRAVRPIWGHVATGPEWVMIGDLTVIVALVWSRPFPRRPARDGIHPGWIVGGALCALAAGLVVDWAGLGQYPIYATARSAGPSEGPGLDYLVYLPRGYHRSLATWPVILALHGSGAVGGDLERVRAEGLPPRIEKEGSIPFIVVAPRSPGHGWDRGALLSLLDEVIVGYRIDATRIYVTGYSMGGYGTWSLATADPGRFAAIAPICGGGDPAWAGALRHVPVWAFHGDQDRLVLPNESLRMIDAISEAGGDARLTVYPGVGHDSWTKTYQDKRLFDWFLSHRRP